MECVINNSSIIEESCKSSVPVSLPQETQNNVCSRLSVDNHSLVRPSSPCDSEISVGCDEETHEEKQPQQQQTSATPPSSPMDMTGGTNFTTEDEGGDETEMEPQSPSTSRGGPSPALSSTSLSYLSEDEYFRPLKRLAMSGSSPTPAERLRILHQNSSFSSQNSVLSPPLLPPRLVPSPESVRPVQIIPSIVLPSKKSTEEEQQEMIQRSIEEEKTNRLRSFSILDILSYKPPPSRRKSSVPIRIVRPWDTREDEDSADEKSPIRTQARPEPQSNTKSNNKNDRGGALDALFKMTNQTLDNLNKDEKADASNLFNNRQPPKKKRKSRTAFTNHQIFELEKRFLYQKYLSPADRDDLSQNLGLSNAQVITWFQNRRAKLKRDMEELKRDVENAKCITSSIGQDIPQSLSNSFANKSLLEASVNMAAFMKTGELPKLPLVSLSR